MILRSIVLAILALPLYKEDRPVTLEKVSQLEAVSFAIHAAAKTPDEAAFLIAWGEAESKFSLRVAAGRCKPTECDKGRARGPWQIHRFASMSPEQWDRMHGVENIDEQAVEAARKARWALRQCPADRIRGAFRVLGGLGCSRPLKGEAERVATFNRVRAKL